MVHVFAIKYHKYSKAQNTHAQTSSHVVLKNTVKPALRAVVAFFLPFKAVGVLHCVYLACVSVCFGRVGVSRFVCVQRQPQV